jgi:tRNA pseudouridine38-40 synthase
VGLKDFRSFTDPSQEQRSTRVEVIYSQISEHRDIIIYHVVASHFLWKQVRRMTGVIVEAGRGKLTVGDISSFFKNQSDIPARLTAPPSGLFLERVYYKNDEILSGTNPVLNL